MGHLKRFISGITISILSSRTNFPVAHGGNIRASVHPCSRLFLGCPSPKIRSEYGAVLKTSDIHKMVREIWLPIPYEKG